MNYKWARDYVLELIDQYSVAGTEVPAIYNNQADYLHKIPRLLDDAQVLAATTEHKIRAAAPLANLQRSHHEGMDIYTLPDNCWQLCGGGVVLVDGGEVYRPEFCRLVGRDMLFLPAKLPAGLAIEYYRYPQLLGADPKDDALLDNTPSVQMALPYFAAAHLVMLDNAFAYSALLGEFEARMAVPGEVPRAETETVRDVYGG